MPSKYLDYDGLAYYHTKVGSLLDEKVDIVSGKGLSTNDYTTVEKNKLAGVAPGAEVNIQSNWDETNVNSDAYILNKPTLAAVATSGDYEDLDNKPTIPVVNNGTLVIQKNGAQVAQFTANASTNVTANISVPTTVSELTDAASYVTQSHLNTQLAGKQDSLTAGDYIDISNDVISVEGLVHSDDPVATSVTTATIVNEMVVDGTLTSGKFADGEIPVIIASMVDIGTGAPLAENTLYCVYE